MQLNTELSSLGSLLTVSHITVITVLCLVNCEFYNRGQCRFQGGFNLGIYKASNLQVLIKVLSGKVVFTCWKDIRVPSLYKSFIVLSPFSIRCLNPISHLPALKFSFPQTGET